MRTDPFLREEIALPRHWLSTCSDARLRWMLEKNWRALLRTAPLIGEAIADDDVAFALAELAHLESQTRGLRDMLEHAQKLKIALVGVNHP